MYESYYHLKSDPFLMSPDHRFAYSHADYAQALSHLEYGLIRAEGIVVVTGRPGTGKSTVVEDLLSGKHGLSLEVARLGSTQLDVDDLLRMVAFSFGLEPELTDKASVLITLQRYFRQQYARGRSVLLVIDEAQHLSPAALEELRQLTNIQEKNRLHFQLFLLGQPGLGEVIRGPDMEQFRQRIIAYCELKPLSLADTRDFIGHRLIVAGWCGDPVITGDAIPLIHRFSHGIPRRVNQICSRLLLHGFAEDKHRLDGSDVRAVLLQLATEMMETSVIAELRAMPAPGMDSAEVEYEVTEDLAMSAAASRADESRELAQPVWQPPQVDEDGPVPAPRAESVAPRETEPALQQGRELEPAADMFITAQRDSRVAASQEAAVQQAGAGRPGRPVGRVAGARPAFIALGALALAGLGLGLYFNLGSAPEQTVSPASASESPMPPKQVSESQGQQSSAVMQAEPGPGPSQPALQQEQSESQMTAGRRALPDEPELFVAAGSAAVTETAVATALESDAVGLAATAGAGGLQAGLVAVEGPALAEEIELPDSDAQLPAGDAEFVGEQSDLIRSATGESIAEEQKAIPAQSEPSQQQQSTAIVVDDTERGAVSSGRYVDSGVTTEQGRRVINSDLEQALIPHVELLTRDSAGALVVVPRGLLASSPEAAQRSVDGIGFVMRNFSGVGVSVLSVDDVDYQPVGRFVEREALVNNLVSRLQDSGLNGVSANRLSVFPQGLAGPDGKASVVLRITPVR